MGEPVKICYFRIFRLTRTLKAICVKTIKIIFKSIIAVLVTYSVIFSIAGTAGIIWTGCTIYKPVRAVKRLQKNNPAHSRYMQSMARDLKAKSSGDSIRHRFVPLDSISPNLIQAVLAAEDDGFYVHPGFDISAMAAAFERNRARNKIKYGGSTITQQLAKNLFLAGEKTFARKYQELLYAVLLEAYLDKDRILELYLNYAQWGKTIFGCEAAAQNYYHKPASRLSLWEAGRMAAILAKPARLNPHAAKSIFIGKRVRVIAENMHKRKQISDSVYTHMTGSPAPASEATDDEAKSDSAVTASSNTVFDTTSPAPVEVTNGALVVDDSISTDQ
ncbi:MAG: monofunctional biosynthetic peptidoglycan transglycosylase [Chitinivibrionales bacterium]|nr:monofunctional biosynthetic peptidoglycan transglycosylase [Chitinivibrionales bacterium]